jgi:hypothetical protein
MVSIPVPVLAIGGPGSGGAIGDYAQPAWGSGRYLEILAGIFQKRGSLKTEYL